MGVYKQTHCEACGTVLTTTILPTKETHAMIEWTKKLPHVVGYYLVSEGKDSMDGVICACNVPSGWKFFWADDFDGYRDLSDLGGCWFSKYPINPPEEEKDCGTPYRTPYCGNNLERLK